MKPGVERANRDPLKHEAQLLQILASTRSKQSQEVGMVDAPETRFQEIAGFWIKNY
jgi:hypothetical protein